MSKHVKAARIVDSNEKKDLGEHVPIVLKIESKDDLGRPKRATLYYDEEKIALEGGEEFLVVFAKRDCVAPVTRGDA